MPMISVYIVHHTTEHNAHHRVGAKHFMKPFLCKQHGNYINNFNNAVSLA